MMDEENLSNTDVDEPGNTSEDIQPVSTTQRLLMVTVISCIGFILRLL
jgi:hypothetical protein